MDQSLIIQEYSKNPPNNFIMEDFTIFHKEESRVCGDDITIYLKIKENKILDFSFIGNTSIITKASASIFWESIIWLYINEILDYKLDYIISLIWEISPRRKHWATLGLLATRNVIHKYINDWISDDFTDILE